LVSSSFRRPYTEVGISLYVLPQLLSTTTRFYSLDQIVQNKWKVIRVMKIESLREVKAKLIKIVKDPPSERSAVITKNGRPCVRFSR
jgi:hypothetical protein